MNRTVHALPLYDRLVDKYNNEVRYKDYDLNVESAKINTIMAQCSVEHGNIIGELIFALIYHHEIVNDKGLTFKNIPYGGTVVSRGRVTKGPSFDMRKLPPFLQQLIIVFINEIITGS